MKQLFNTQTRPRTIMKRREMTTTEFNGGQIFNQKRKYK